MVSDHDNAGYNTISASPILKYARDAYFAIPALSLSTGLPECIYRKRRTSLKGMMKIRGSRHLIRGNTGARGRNRYFIMVRVSDWKLSKKTDFIRSLVSDMYVFPPFQHITLYGPFFLRDGLHPDILCQAIESACGRSPGFALNSPAG